MNRSRRAGIPRHLIWLARFRVALRWYWPLDAAILAGNTLARALTWLLVANQAQVLELNPVAARLFATYGVTGVMVATGLVAVAILLGWQTLFAANGQLGKRIGLVSTWAVLVMATADAVWDVAQVLAH